MTQQEARKKALAVQDACNPRAVARLLVEVIDSACENGGGTAGARGNSAVYLVLDKLASLGLYEQCFEPNTYSKHYDACLSETETV